MVVSLGATAVAIGDLNGDGRADLVTGNSLLLAKTATEPFQTAACSRTFRP